MAKAWTTNELAQLKKLAGRYSVGAIAHILGRSENAVRVMASSLGVSLRYYESKLEWCVQCSKHRTRTNRDGLCPVCIKKRRLKILTKRMDTLPPSDLYERQKLSDETSMKEQLDEERKLDKELKRAQKSLERRKKSKPHTNM